MSQHLADYYSNPDLQEQARQTLDYVQGFFGLRAMSKNSPIVDLGCGIGTLVIGLARDGWTDVSGIDYAEQMVEIAREQARAESVSPTFETANILEWAPPSPVQAITCFDVLNHLLESSDVQVLFRHVWEQLAPGGYFLFDVNTRENFASPIWNYENREMGSDQYKMCLNGRFDEKTGRVYAQTLVTLQTAEGPQTMDNTLMCQYHPEESLATWLQHVGFEEIQSFGYSPMDLSQVIPGLKYTKTRFECRKPD